MNSLLPYRWAFVVAWLAFGCSGSDPAADMGAAPAEPSGSGGASSEGGSSANNGTAGVASATSGQGGQAGATKGDGSPNATNDDGSAGRGNGSNEGGVRVSDAASYDGPVGAPNVWTNVTPTNVNLSTLGACGNYGAESVQRDSARPSDLYTLFMCQGVWKSVDFGQTWKGPINTGNNGTTVGDCAGAITIPPNDVATPPTLFASCIRGAGIGFWRSTNGGVDWTRYTVAPAANNQQFYPPVVDPYDPKHLLMTGHGFDLLAQSVDGGQTWSVAST